MEVKGKIFLLFYYREVVVLEITSSHMAIHKTVVKIHHKRRGQLNYPIQLNLREFF